MYFGIVMELYKLSDTHFISIDVKYNQKYDGVDSKVHKKIVFCVS